MENRRYKVENAPPAVGKSAALAVINNIKIIILFNNKQQHFRDSCPERVDRNKAVNAICA
jgi:hypothetical protein